MTAFPKIDAIEIQRPSVEIETKTESEEFIEAFVRRSQKAAQVRFNSNPFKVAAMMLPVESTEICDLPIGSVIPAVDALNWTRKANCDIRPRLLDKSSGITRLIDSGSQISVAVKGPEDKVDPSFKLVAVNGSKINTYGIREITENQ